MQPLAKQANCKYTTAHLQLTRFPKIALEDFNNEYYSLKPELLGIVSHELRTPLVGILGMVYQLHCTNTNALTPEQKECIDAIKTSGNQLLYIIDDLLGLNKHSENANGASTSPIKSKRVLMVEDDRLVQKIHIAML